MSNIKEEIVKANNSAVFLIASGLIGRTEVQAQEPNKPTRRSNLNFDPNLEAQYLLCLPEELRINQLKKEVSTSLNEFFLSQVGHTYEIVEGRLVDEETKLDIEKITAEGDVLEEVKAIRKITELFVNEAKQVVHISQRNKDLGYPDNVVDIWLRSGDGKIRVLRSKVIGNEKTIESFYKNIGGKKEHPNKMEMLSDPVGVEKLRLSEILNLLVIEESSSKIEESQILKITEEMMAVFINKYQDELVQDPNIILRFYLATKDVIQKLNANKKIDQIGTYLLAPITIKKTKGGGCGLFSLEGSFAKQGWILTYKDGKLSSYFGSTEGLVYCERCGCWHSGTKCPFCDED